MSCCESLQDKMYAQMALLAKQQGYDYVLNRPVTALNAIPNEIQDIKAKFSAQELAFQKPNKYGNSLWWGFFDGRQTQVGDYLIGDKGTYFIATMQPDLNMLCVECNTIISIESPNLSSRTSVKTNTLMSNWPCSLLQDSKGRGTLDYPQSIGQGEYIVLVPYFSGVEILTGYTVIDSDNNRYMIKVTEKTDLGWRLFVQKIRK